MTRNTRLTQNIANGGSMADIAFLLLIFFMLTTTIVNDQGLDLLLPPHKSQMNDLPVNERNLFKIMINSNDELMVEDKFRDSPKGLRNEVREFVMNNGKRAGYSENPQKAVVSIKTNRGTSQEAYIKVLDEVKAAYYELYADRLGMSSEEFRQLASNNPQYKKARNGIPMNISIAEPF